MSSVVQKLPLDGFQPFGEELKPILKEFLQGSSYTGSDYSYYAFLVWFSEGEYLVHGDVLYLRARLDGDTYYWPPLVKTGSGVSVTDAVAALPDSAMFAFCTEEFVNATYGGYYVYTHRDWGEYVYRAEDFISLAGKRYHAKRNHIAKFTKTYSHTVEKLVREDIPDIVEFEREWLAAHSFEGSAEESAERERAIARGWIEAALRGELAADVLRVDGKLVGIAIGEISPTGVGIEMYEKADTDYEGAYTFLAHEFAARNFASCTYINRQEDMGLEGLRKSKLSYYPEFILEKFVLKPAYSFSECYAARTGKLMSKTIERVRIPREKLDIRLLDETAYDEVRNFLESEREALANKLFFLNYTPEELSGVLRNGSMFGAYLDGALVATCAVDRDAEYGKKLAEVCGDESGGKWFEFSGIMTAARVRGQGVSSTLCGEVIAYARRELAPCTLCAVVQFDNAASLANLQKQGFVLRVTRPFNEYTFSYLTLELAAE